MGTVYRAQHMVVRDYVALKLFRSGLAEDESIRKRFLREPQLAAQIRHPNIIPIRDAGDENGLPYLAMEYVEGLDLPACSSVRDGWSRNGRSRSWAKRPARSTRRTHATSSTATSSRRTSSLGTTDGSSSRTSESPRTRLSTA